MTAAQSNRPCPSIPSDDPCLLYYEKDFVEDRDNLEYLKREINRISREGIKNRPDRHLVTAMARHHLRGNLEDEIGGMALEILTKKFEGWIRRMAAKYPTNTRMDRQDLVQTGMMGMLTAIKRYDPRRADNVITYITFWVKKEIIDFVNKNYSDLSVPYKHGGRLGLKNGKVLHAIPISSGNGELDEERVVVSVPSQEDEHLLMNCRRFRERYPWVSPNIAKRWGAAIAQGKTNALRSALSPEARSAFDEFEATIGAYIERRTTEVPANRSAPAQAVEVSGVACLC